MQQLSTLAGVSVRTLHYYDEIGLLSPAARTESRYRLYGEPELLRLQQVLLYRELEVPLAEIGRILDAPEYDLAGSLRSHRQALVQRMERTHALLVTIDKTLERITEDDMNMTDAGLYEGFPQETIDRYKREAREMFDPQLVEASEKRARKMSKAAWAALKAEGEAVNQALAGIIDRDPADSEVQALIARHHATIEPFYHATAEIYCGLGSLYVEHPEFRACYEKYATGLPEFMHQAMTYYADHVLAPGEVA
ncbi:MerR family transcriptional regulator [Candidatus Bipolaricaulota bacterium]